MTRGLLISRATKLKLHKIAVKERTQQSIDHYKRYRNLYNVILRQSKKLYFDKILAKTKKKSKKDMGSS